MDITMDFITRAVNGGSAAVPAVADSWPTKDVSSLRFTGLETATKHYIKIIYVSVIGVVMLAALLEWFLWLAAFIYCLVKVFQKAETWSVRVLAAVMMILFTAFR